MPDFINENGDFTDDFRSELPERLGDDYYNDPETKQQPTKEFDNVKNIFDMARMVVNGSRKISAHGEELKKATEGMIRVPGEGASEEDITNYRKAIGVPDTPEGYELPIPDDADAEGTKKLVEVVSKAAIAANIPKSKLQAVFEPVVRTLAENVKEMERKGMELLGADIQALKDAKKEKYDAFIADTDKVAAYFDVAEDVQAGIKANPIGDNFMNLMKTMGIADTPVVREFLGAIAPLVIEGKTMVGAGAKTGGTEGGFDYEYDENGKPK